MVVPRPLQQGRLPHNRRRLRIQRLVRSRSWAERAAAHCNVRMMIRVSPSNGSEPIEISSVKNNVSAI